MKTIAFLNVKGGVGKTTSVTTVAHLLASEYGKKTLIIDTDPQANTTALFSEIDYYNRIQKKFDGELENLEYSISNLLIDKDIDIHKCISKTKYENLDIIKSDLQLTEIENRLKADVTSPQQFRLARHLKAIETEYDYCIIDCSPSVSIVNINGLAVADEVFIPTRTDGYSIEGVAYAQSLIETVSEYNLKLKIGGVFFVAWENFNCPKVAYQVLESLVGNLLLPIRINKNKLLAENTMQQTPLLELDRRKRTRATQSYIKLTEYILSKNRTKYIKTMESENRKESV